MKGPKSLVGAALLLLLAGCASTDTSDQTTTEGVGAATTTDEVVTTAAATSTAAATQTSEGTLSFGTVEPGAIDPGLSSDAYGIHIARLVFDGLTDIDKDLQVVEAVAESWETADNVTWTFHLRDGVTFTNGRPVTAQDFVFAWNRVASPDTASPVAYHGLPISGWGEVMDGTADTIEGVRAIDDSTLEVVTSQPFVLLPKVLSHTVFSPVPEEELSEGFADQPVGNGPYLLESPWEHNVRVPLVRNAEYYGTPGVPEVIEVRLYSDNDAMFRDVQGGNLDIGYQSVGPGTIATAISEFGDRFLEVPVGSVIYLQFPVTVEPYSDVDFRRALSMAIDREAIAERIWEGTMSPATGLVPAQAEGAVSDGCPWCEFDPEQAADLLATTGGAPAPIKIYHEPSLGGDDAEAIANSWRTALGIETELVPLEFDPLLELIYSGVTDGVVHIGWIWDYPSAYSFLSPLLESTSGDNTGLWANEEFDALLEQARTAPSEADAIPYLEDAQRIFGDQLPLVPLYFATDLSVHSERVSNVVETAQGIMYLEGVQIDG